MQSLTTLKTKSQESLARFTDTVQQQPSEVQLWGTVAAAAVVGGLVVAATAKGVLAITGVLASSPVALTVGAVGGGLIGWSYMQKQQPTPAMQPAEVTSTTA